MNRPRYYVVSVLAGIGLLALWAARPVAAQQAPPPPTPAPNQNANQPGPDQGSQAEALTRGPVHEAFAETMSLNPQPGIVVPKAPPELINEVPPDQAPADGNYVWIPGYWGWDDDHQDFVWVSGVWRIPPPGAEWVPGYWSQTDQGYQWIAGYWWYRGDSSQEQQVNYLPQPPDSLETGPSGSAPSDDYFWVPGCWIWRDVQYVWQAGYWARGVPDWVWVPTHYMWAPGGCVFIAGHWDYPLNRRGILFAPIRFPSVVYSQPQFRYVPSVVINVTVIQTSLFLRPRYCHYYFGDYYGPMYREVGIYPWFTVYSERRGYDPLFTYAFWHHRRQDPRWFDQLQDEYRYREAHEDARPPHTYRDFERWEGEHREGGRTFRLAAPLTEVSRIEKLPFQLEGISPQRRDEFSQRRQQLHQFAQQREQMEQDLGRQAEQQGAENRRPLQSRLPRSPIAQGLVQRGGEGQQPPGLAEGRRGRPEAAPGSEAERLTDRTAPPQRGERRGESASRRPQELSRMAERPQQPGQAGQPPGQQPLESPQERRTGRQPLESQPGQPQGQQPSQGPPQTGNQQDGRQQGGRETPPGRPQQPGQPSDGSRFNPPGGQSPGQQGQRFDQGRRFDQGPQPGQGQRSDQGRGPNQGQRFDQGQRSDQGRRFDQGPGQRGAPGQMPGSRQQFQQGPAGPARDRGGRPDADSRFGPRTGRPGADAGREGRGEEAPRNRERSSDRQSDRQD